MLTLDGETSAADAPGSPPPRPSRLLGPPRRLPGSRAVLGGFLVATAAVATFGAYVEATANHEVAYVVADHPLAPGSRLTAGDLRTEPMTLPSATSSEAFTSPRQLAQAVLVAPLRSGELVQAGDVARAGPASSPRQLSFSVDPARAVDGSLAAGDRVDLLATFGSGSAATTTVVASDLLVLARHDETSALSPSTGPTEVLTVGIDPTNDPLAIVQALNTGQVVVVRTTGTEPQAGTSQQAAPAESPPSAPSPSDASAAAPSGAPPATGQGGP